ncbi:hypothetical protein ACGFJ7_21140 [Actinoplanes sp. NPDC048988]|uniref:hypothetical protein n=1 Tax=Actinoplanes sp. NPDC048988 TaxID=3363901 RepID=UPI00371D5E66
MATGRQLKVYLHPEDRPAVDDYVRRELGGVLLRERSADRASLVTADSRDGMARLIGLASQAARLEPRYVEPRDEWVMSLQSGPLIEWWFSKLDDDQLYPGRFYYLPHDDEPFTKAATSLFTWVRRYAPAVPAEWGPERLGPAAAEMVRAGKLSLRRNPPGSRA